MSIVMMCCHYGFDLKRRRPTCAKGHRASLRCHEERKDCPDYISTSEKEKYRQAYIKFIGEAP